MQSTNSVKNPLIRVLGSSDSARNWVRMHVDQTNLDPGLTSKQLDKLVLTSAVSGIKRICIPSTMVKEAAGHIKGMSFDIEIVTVIGFPHGNELSIELKKHQINSAHRDGAAEADFVINLSLWRSNRNAFIEELYSLVNIAHFHGMKAKAIIETYYLSDAEIVELSGLLGEASADFIKTSTGFAVSGNGHPQRQQNGTGATQEVITLIRKGISSTQKTGLKLSGGIRTAEDAANLLEKAIGAGWAPEMLRIGSSSGFEILKSLYDHNGHNGHDEHEEQPNPQVAENTGTVK